MNLHEFQAKRLLRKYKILMPSWEIAHNEEEAYYAAHKLGGHEWILKAQIHAGDREAAGGIRLVTGLNELEEVTNSLIGQRLITTQTGEAGQPVHQLLIALPCKIEQELHLMLMIDAEHHISLIASHQKIMTIPAELEDGDYLKISINPIIKVSLCMAHRLIKFFDLPYEKVQELYILLQKLYYIFLKFDCQLIKISPMAVDNKGQFICLGARIVIDDHALYRQFDIREMIDLTQMDALEQQIQACHLDYIALDGKIGCMANDRGLGLATMDLIQSKGGSIAHMIHLDHEATHIADAFKILLEHPNLQAILINLFGNTMACDAMIKKLIPSIPLNLSHSIIMRLQGDGVEKAIDLLKKSQLPFIIQSDFSKAVSHAVQFILK